MKSNSRISKMGRTIATMLLVSSPSYSEENPVVPAPVYSVDIVNGRIYYIGKNDVKYVGNDGQLIPASNAPEFLFPKDTRELAEIIESDGNIVTNHGALGHEKSLTFLVGEDTCRVTLKNTNEDSPLFRVWPNHMESDILRLDVKTPKVRLHFEDYHLDHAANRVRAWDRKGKSVSLNPLETQESEDLTSLGLQEEFYMARIDYRNYVERILKSYKSQKQK